MILRSLPALLFAFLLAPATHAVIPTGSIEIHEAEPDRVFEIELRGVIAYPMAREMEETFRKIPPSAEIRMYLNSPGGSNTEGLKIIGTLKSETARGRKIRTHVRSGSLCGSMCVPLFVQGMPHTAGSSAIFMFHGSFQAAFTNIPDPRVTASLLNLFIDAGVSPVWLDSLKAQGVFRDPGEYYISSELLLAEGSNVVTRIEAAPSPDPFRESRATVQVVEVEDQGFYAIELDGSITEGVAEAVEKSLSRIPGGAKIILILKSSNGTESEARKLAFLIRDQVQQGRELGTYVRHAMACVGVCVPVFVQGKTHRSGAAAVFQYASGSLDDLLLQAGVSRPWISNASRTAAYFTGEELLAQESGVVQETSERHVKLKPWRAPIDPNLGPR